MITALIGDLATVGKIANRSSNWSPAAHPRRNSQFASARIRTVQNPHIVSSSLGGWISADFTIPAWEAQQHRSVLKYGATTWLFDGQTPIFYGWAEKPTWAADGSCLMNITGAWNLLSKMLMREAWDLWDMSLLAKGTGANENKNGQATLNSDGSLTLSFANGTVIAASDRVSVDVLLFGEQVGTFDDKTINAFEFNISDAAGTALTANRRIRVVGKATAAAGSGDLLYDTGSTGSSTKQGAFNLNGTNQGGVVWPSGAGYRCLRFEYIYTVGVTVSADQYVTFDRIRVGTREALFPTVSGGVVNLMDTAAIARDLLTMQVPGGAVTSSASYDIPQEFWPSDVGTNGFGPPSGLDGATLPYSWGGLDPRIPLSSCPNSGIGINGFSALEWQSSADILASLAEVDGYHVGFYLPYNGRGGYDSPGHGGPVALVSAAAIDAGSMWFTAPPTLYYQPFTDPATNPDYTIHTLEGAQVDVDTDAQPLVDIAFVNYQNLRGRQLSQVVFDETTTNYLYAQGYRRAEDFTVEPSTGDAQGPTALAQQLLSGRRNPYQSATIRIQNQGPRSYPILNQGAVVSKLSTVRPGSVRIVDMLGGSGLRAGIATTVEWWGQTLDQPETLQITLGVPARPTGERITGKIVCGAARRRNRVL